MTAGENIYMERLLSGQEPSLVQIVSVQLAAGYTLEDLLDEDYEGYREYVADYCTFYGIRNPDPMAHPPSGQPYDLAPINQTGICMVVDKDGTPHRREFDIFSIRNSLVGGHEKMLMLVKNEHLAMYYSIASEQPYADFNGPANYLGALLAGKPFAGKGLIGAMRSVVLAGPRSTRWAVFGLDEEQERHAFEFLQFAREGYEPYASTAQSLREKEERGRHV